MLEAVNRGEIVFHLWPFAFENFRACTRNLFTPVGEAVAQHV